MINSHLSPWKVPLLALLAIQPNTWAQSVTVGIGEGGTQIEAGAVNTTKDGLNAEAGQLWGVSNTANRDGMLYFTYSSLAGASLPSTIQAGTYTFTARIGSSNVGGGFSGLNDLSAGSNTDKGNVAGFFSTLNSNAETAKNNMVAEFNTQTGVSYIQASEADPASLAFTTWTFTWTVAAGSPVIGTNPFFGVYTKTGTGGGNGFWDDSTLTYSGSAGPGQTNSINVNFHADDGNALADHQLTSGEDAGVAPLDGSHWNNINLGAPQAQSGTTIFTTTSLSDELGNGSAATLSSDLNSGASGSWFVGYAASSASDQAELNNGISDDTLFNSYLATNDSDNFSLNISGLGSGFTAGGYNLIIYSDSDRRGSTANNTRRSIYTITPNGGSPITGFVEDDDGVTPVNTFNGTYIQSDGVDNGSDYSNYVVFSGLTSADFTLEIDSPDGGRGAISGFQIISQAGSDPLPTIAGFSANIDTLTAPGTAVTLSWDVAEATALSISPNIGDVMPLTVNGVGQTTVTVDAETTFTLTASNDVGTVTSDFVVTAPLPVVSFTADDLSIQPDEPVILSWDVTGASSVAITDIGNVSSMSSTTVNPSETTIYTLSATNVFGTTEAELTVRVRPAGSGRPNILFCLVDDWGVMDTSEPFSYDSYVDGAQPVMRAFNNFYQTPHMEQLAADGMKFTQAYALPVCSPTRTSVMTGFNAPRHGVTVHLNLNGTYERPSGSNVATHRSPNNWRFRGMEVTDVTLPRLLSEDGYRSIHCGKAHFGARGDVTEDPREIGFDINLGGSGAGSPGRYIGNPGFSSGSNPVPYIGDYEGNGKYLTEALTEAISDAMEDAVNDDVPFFAYMSYYAVHSPFTTNPNATGNYSGAANNNHGRFATMVEGVDTSLGQLRAKLEELGVAENTLIIFTGDNGSDSPALSSRNQIGNAFSDYPIRGKKANCYEGGYHVPLFMAWGKNDPTNVFQQQLPITGGSVEHDIVSVVDIPTTILAVADVPHPDMDGVDLSPYLTSTPGTHRKQTLLRHQPNSQNSSYFTAYRRDDYKLIYFYYEDPADAFELYDLAADRDESNNLASSNPQLVLELAREMAQALDDGWGEYGALWPTLNGGGDGDRPFVDDPFVIDFTVDGRASIDSDMDGLFDILEDADANGLTGASETDAENPDTDGDRTNDFDETRLNLDPLDTNSYFRLQALPLNSVSMRLAWPSAPGLFFNIRSSDDLSSPIANWDVFSPNVEADATLSETFQEIPFDSPRKFFSIELLPAVNP